MNSRRLGIYLPGSRTHTSVKLATLLIQCFSTSTSTSAASLFSHNFHRSRLSKMSTESSSSIPSLSDLALNSTSTTTSRFFTTNWDFPFASLRKRPRGRKGSDSQTSQTHSTTNSSINPESLGYTRSESPKGSKKGRATEISLPPILMHPAAEPLLREPSTAAPNIAKIVFLGTSSAIPSPKRNTSAMAIILSTGSTILVDCGEGTQHQIMRTRSVNLSRVDAICITHVHGDHCFGLFGLLCSRESTEPLTIIGPPILEKVLETVLTSCGSFDISSYKFIPIPKNESFDVGAICGLHLRTYPLPHTVPSIAYHFRELDRPGPLIVEKAKAAGIKGKELARLKNEGFAISDSGQRVEKDGLVGPDVKGRSIAIIQDTSDATSLIPRLQECDIVIHECTFDRNLWKNAVDYGHSTSDMAGKFGGNVRAKLLLLSHFSQRYGRRTPDTPATELTLESLVLEALEAYTLIDRFGPLYGVYAAEDFLLFEHKNGVLQFAGSDLKPEFNQGSIEFNPVRLRVDTESLAAAESLQTAESTA